MKLGIAYNIFNGDELLEDSLMRIRKHADYITLTYQTISNIGNKADEGLEDTISTIDKSLYDEIVLFQPKLNLEAKKNETQKRQLGLKYAKKNNCTHFLSLDCDEFYDDDQFLNAKKIIQQKKYKSTACELVNYFHSSKYQLIEKKRYVPFIAEIDFFTKFKLHKKFPVSVDPSRVCNNRKFYLFKKEDLQMHHMSYVRKNIFSLKSKLKNSPNHKLFEPILDDYLNYFNNWTPNQPGLNPHDYLKDKNINCNISVVQNPIKLSIKYLKNENITLK